MFSKVIAFTTLLTFSFCSISCFTTQVEYEMLDTSKSYVEIDYLVKTDGENIQFDITGYGRIEGDTIVGVVFHVREISQDEIAEIIRDRWRISEVITKDGEKFSKPPFEEIERQGDVIYLRKHETVSVPISEVEYVGVRKKVLSIGKTVLLVGGLGLIVLVAVALARKSSCPFIYSYDGERYVFDAEPYGGAVVEALKKTEWCELEHLNEVDGEYRLMITNEVNETQYTDELKLLVVDHPKGVRVVSSVDGELHSISNPVAPIRAYDGRGNELLNLVREKDMRIWQTLMEEREARNREDLRDELVFEFPKPEGAKQVKLLVNASTTLWGSAMIREYLEFFGGSVDAYYAELNRGGKVYEKFQELVNEREMYVMKIRVRSGDGWVEKGLLQGGGPFISEDRVYVLDIGDVTEKTLTIKLVAPATFWLINQVAVDYSEDVPVEVEELRISRAVTKDGQEIRNKLMEEDEEYHEMPEVGDWAEASFIAPGRKESLERTVFAKVNGYYDLHLKKEGRPRYFALMKAEYDPDFMIRYAVKGYKKWQEAMESHYTASR